MKEYSCLSLTYAASSEHKHRNRSFPSEIQMSEHGFVEQGFVFVGIGGVISMNKFNDSNCLKFARFFAKLFAKISIAFS